MVSSEVVKKLEGINELIYNIQRERCMVHGAWCMVHGGCLIRKKIFCYKFNFSIFRLPSFRDQRSHRREFEDGGESAEAGGLQSYGKFHFVHEVHILKEGRLEGRHCI